VIDGHATVGDDVSLQTGAYVPPGSTLGDEVFLGPHAVVTNDAYPVRTSDRLRGAQLADHVSVGAHATILPGVSVGRGSFVAAGSVVTEDVPPETLAVGAPAQHRQLPDQLRGGNQIA
jgi:acetyltransferase-like isoleucine patch superfamily enzyme